MSRPISLFLILLISTSAKTQSGIWTWMHGPTAANEPGIFGTQGISSPSNRPPNLYEAATITDIQGDFWLFGGNNSTTVYSSDVWKYDPLINEWTWIKGSGLGNQAGNYGILGIAAPSNNPGARANGFCTWVDGNGDFWIFGGYGYDDFGAIGPLNDLWKYQPASNNWTWMKGPNTTYSLGNFGSQGIPTPTNLPPSRCETKACWVSQNGLELWFYGGIGDVLGITDTYSDIWKYDILTNEWTWMAGPNTTNNLPIYGNQGVASPGNSPGGRMVYSKWRDLSGNFWIFGGRNHVPANSVFGDLWKFDPVSLQWTWVSGSSTVNYPGVYSVYCDPNSNSFPSARWENPSCWVDSCGRFWMHGGAPYSTASKNDMWCYDSNSNKWIWVFGTNLLSQPSIYGILGVPAPTNIPSGRYGSPSWTDNQGNLWLWGGTELTSPIRMKSDMWRFTIDPSCSGSGSSTIANFNFDPISGFSPLPVFFTNLSINADSFLWNFGDGTISNLRDPTHIFQKSGDYLITLLAWGKSCQKGLDTFQVVISINLFIPNIFSPNSDGIDDEFFVKYPGEEPYKIQIIESIIVMAGYIITHFITKIFINNYKYIGSIGIFIYIILCEHSS